MPQAGFRQDPVCKSNEELLDELKKKHGESETLQLVERVLKNFPKMLYTNNEYV